jgi:hypothetical protein
MDDATHITTMIANFWVFCTFAIENFATDPPAIWSGLNEFIVRLKSPQGKSWTNKHIGCTHVFYHMVSDLQNMLCPFINISNNYAYRMQVKTNTAIAPQAYDDATTHAQYQVRRLNNILVSSDMGDYRDVPPIMSLLVKQARDGSKQNTTPIKVTPPYQGGGGNQQTKFVTPDNAKPQKGTRRNDTTNEVSQEKINDMKTKGLVKFSGAGKPPIANDILVTNPKTKEKTMICTNHITVNYFCRHGKQCNFLHLFKISDLTAEERKTYCAFVEKTPDLEWVNKPKTTVG